MNFMEHSGLCRRCVMDTSAREITFDEKGICNFCNGAEKELEAINWNWILRANSGEVVKLPIIPRPSLYKENRYDCLIGLSGGVDSSFALYKATQLGFRPLCFTIDNGYNKPEADENIMRLVEGLKVPFFRYTINLQNFKAMQAAFIEAGVKNIEIPTDHILMAASFELAARYGIQTIISGGNVATESIMPASWGHNARDLKHVKAIYHGSYDGIPTCSLLWWNIYKWWYKIKTVYLLDHLNYNRNLAEKFLISRFDFKSTGEKHEENYFTWWFQSFYLFKKYGIDKRKAHFSSLIMSGQMTRKEALEKLQKNPIYPDLGIELKAMKYPRHEHSDYPIGKGYERVAKIVKLCGF